MRLKEEVFDMTLQSKEQEIVDLFNSRPNPNVLHTNAELINSKEGGGYAKERHDKIHKLLEQKHQDELDKQLEALHEKRFHSEPYYAYAYIRAGEEYSENCRRDPWHYGSTGGAGFSFDVRGIYNEEWLKRRRNGGY